MEKTLSLRANLSHHRVQNFAITTITDHRMGNQSADEGNQYALCSLRRVPVLPLGKIEKVDHVRHRGLKESVTN